MKNNQFQIFCVMWVESNTNLVQFYAIICINIVIDKTIVELWIWAKLIYGQSYLFWMCLLPGCQLGWNSWNENVRNSDNYFGFASKQNKKVLGSSVSSLESYNKYLTF